jgi:hypothetical protein
MRNLLQSILIISVIFGSTGPLCGQAKGVFVTRGHTVTASDIVGVSIGANEGLRTGGVGKLFRGMIEIADVIVVGTRASCAVALITSLVTEQTVKTGDLFFPTAPNYLKTNFKG